MFALLLSSILTVTNASATTLLIVTDQPNAVRAREVRALFQNTEPYSLMKDLKLKVIQTTPTKLGCELAAPSVEDVSSTASNDDEALLARSESRERTVSITSALPPSCSVQPGPGPITRLISCDTPQTNSYLAALQRTERAQFAIVVVTDPRYGGSGGQRPVMTTGSPAAMAMHELMHQLGFADEYAYISACEADIYCTAGADDTKSASGYGALPGTSFNVAAFNARPSYSSNEDARRAHAKQVPWISSIAPRTNIISNGKLGTPRTSGATGVYRAIVCDKATDHLETWQPVAVDTIMKTLSTTRIPKTYWPTIAKSLGTHITP
jgi:hypothetical protein